jgi:hypothetical protein
MEAKVQRALIWSGPAMVVLWVGAFILLPGFIPPHDPEKTAEEIVRTYAGHTGAIKVGMIVSMAGSALLVPWAVAISGQLKRINGARPSRRADGLVRLAVPGVHHADRRLDGGELPLRGPGHPTLPRR